MAVDINVALSKLLRTMFLRRQTLAFGSMDQKRLSEVVGLAESGRLFLQIGEQVMLGGPIDLIMRVEAGATADGRALIVFD